MPRLHSLCTEHAVISARRPRVFGNAAPDAAVTVQLAGQTAQGIADASGHWRVEFPALHAGGPHTLIASDASGEVRARDILLGDVWLGSGQSNMEWSLSLTKDTDADIAAADEPRLRVFMVGKAQDAFGPADTLGGLWVVSTPKEAAAFSAIGYFFGRRLIAGTDRPCGVIVAAWGGSAIAPWLPEETLSSRPEYASFRAELAQGQAQPEPAEQGQPHQDPGIAPHAATWAASDFDDSAWTPLPVPGQWQNHGWAFNGAVWFRRTVEIRATWIGRALELHLGNVDDCDRTFVNGVFIGGIGNETPNWWSTPRNHLVPAALITSTTLTIAVRVFDNWGEGGIMGNVCLRPLDAADAETLNLNGTWHAKSELELPLRSPSGPALVPSALWNAMIHPLLNASLDGALWYQGESDVGRARLYPRLLTDLINSWRHAFDAPGLPFGIVQLANFEKRVPEPTEAPWAELREAQRRVAATVPACGLASAIDAGEAEDIHPRYKKIVGERLALWALRENCGHTALAYSGPAPAECWPEAAGLRVRFCKMRPDAGTEPIPRRLKAIRFSSALPRSPPPSPCATPGKPTRKPRSKTPPACPPRPFISPLKRYSVLRNPHASQIMTNISKSFRFDISQVPFSRRGSRFAFGRLPERRARELGKEPGLFLRTVAGGVAMERREIFRVEALIKGKSVATDAIATPEKLTLVKGGGTVEAAFASESRLLFRGTGLGLRLSGDGGWYTTLRPAGPGVWELNVFAQRLQLMLTLRAGKIKIDAPWDKDACKHVRIDLLPDDSGTWELEIEEFRTAWEAPAHIISFDAAVATARTDFAAWLDESLSASPAFAAARPLAAYINWTSLVSPRGHFKREAMLMSKNWMINVWSWDHCFNAIALAKLQPSLAWDQWAVMFDHQNEHGALPDCINDADIVWNFTKPPVHGWALREMLAQGMVLSKPQLEEARHWLSAWTTWWLRYRDDDHDGLPSYNHGNDSGWDNATFMNAGPPVEGADLAAFLIVQMDVLAGLCEELKKPKDAKQWRADADALFLRLIEHSWREDHFVSPRSGDHLVADGDSLVPFMPLLLGDRLDDSQRAALVRGVKRFVTPHGLATENPQSPLYQPNGYWRGPVWAPSTHLIIAGLLACGEEKLANRIARAFCKTCVKSGMAENFDALTGEGLCDRAYTWTASVFQILAAKI